MAKRSVFDFSTAYAQLILLVFLPICVLAGVGALLVFHETSRAAHVEQQAIANTAFSQYTAQLQTLQAKITQLQLTQQQLNLTEIDPNNTKINQKRKDTLSQNLSENQQILKFALQNIPNDRHILGMAVVTEQAVPLVSVGNWNLDNLGSPQDVSNSDNMLLPTLKESMPQLVQSGHSVDNPLGTLYAKKLDLTTIPLLNESKTKEDKSALSNSPLWLVVNVDDEPIKLARYQVMMALAVTGLFTILLLLLSLNVYARRWIAPIYEMRLHLQRTEANSLYKPMPIQSSGELNQLQQDLVKTFRRLHTSFQELKNHAEETEDDLRLAFDEMEMQNISIRNARDIAISASQTKSAFLANISHELRTPLNSIDGFINLLARNAGLTPEQNLYVETIRKSSAHLLALVNDVLDFSKMEAGKLVLDRHELDLYACIYDVADMLSPLAGEKGLDLAVFFYDDVPRYLEGDALRIKQVLTNLVNNAIKFTEKGEVVIRVSLDEDEANNNDERILIAVTDTGKGVDKDQQNVLFQSFSQGDPSITRQYGGTGLGLVISKQLTQMMGGTIGFTDNASLSNASNSNASDSNTSNSHTDTPQNNQKNQGSTFWFTLPIRLSASQAHLPKDLAELNEWQFPSIFGEKGYPNYPNYASGVHNDGKMHILIWLSHTASLQVFKGSLNQLPVVITVENSLAGVLEQLKTQGNRWDWVIVDSQNQADNISLLKQIRLHYAGKLAVFGYQLNLNTEILSRYQAQPLYEPLDRRQLYQLLGNETRPTNAKPLPKWQGYRVLAVDDHPPNLLVLEALLAELGIEVISVNSGFDAIDYIQQHQDQPQYRVDLIFMDIQMPKMSGQEATQQIRQLEPYDYHVPIIALTAHSLSDEREALLAIGIDDYVGKPISQTQLLQILQKWLGKQSGDVQIASPMLLENKPLLVEKEEKNTAAPVLIVKDTPTLPQNIPPVKAVTTPTAGEIAENPLAVIDWEDALVRAAGKSDLAANLMMMLIDSIDTEKTDLATAWAAKDRQVLADIAHRILGASRYTGVPALRQASQNFEDKCLLNVQNTSPAQFALLTPHYEQLITALNALQTIDLSPWSHLYYYRLDEQNMAWKMI